MSEDLFGYFGTLETTVIEDVQEDGHRSPSFRWFDCLGEASVNDVYLHNNSYICSKEDAFLRNSSVCENNRNLRRKCEKVFLFGRTWDKGSVLLTHLDVFFKMLSRELMEIEFGAKMSGTLISSHDSSRRSLKEKDYSEARRSCVELCLFLRHYIESLQKNKSHHWILETLIPKVANKLSTLRKCLGHLLNLPSYVYLHSSNSGGNKCHSPSYHLMHVHLDLRWLHLTLLLSLARAEGATTIKNISENFHQPYVASYREIIKHIQLLISELFQIGVARFDKTDLNDFSHRSPFSCSCVKEIWLLVQLLTDLLHQEDVGQPFWKYVDDQLDILIGKRSCMSNDIEIDCKTIQCTKEILPSNQAVCSLWILYHVAKVYTYKHGELCKTPIQSNYSILEVILKMLVSDDIKEAEMRKCLVLIEELCLHLWEPRTEPLLSLWEYYHKKLNNSFYAPGASLESLGTVNKSALGLISQVKSFLSDPAPSVSNSFQHFLRILGLHIQKSKSVSRHWNLLRGRIFSKFSPAKMESLTKTGDYNFTSLFLILALSAEISQVENKMIELTNLSIKVKGSASCELIKGQLGLVILIAEKGLNISRSLQPLVTIMNGMDIVENKETFRLFVEAMQDILDSNESLSLGQHVFIDTWIGRFLSNCTSSTDVSRLTDALLCMVLRLKRMVDLHIGGEQEIIIFLEKLWDQLNSYFNTVNCQTSPPYQVADLAAKLAIIFLNLSNKARFHHLFEAFASHDQTNIKLIRRFLCHLNVDECMKNSLVNYDKALIKAWVRCNLICCDTNHAEMQELTCSIAGLKELEDLQPDLLHKLKNSDEPLIELMGALNLKYITETNIYEKQKLREKVNYFLDGIDNWLKPILTPPKVADEVQRIYSIVGNIFRLNSPLLYIKSKPNSLLQQLMDLLLLPVFVHNLEAKIHPYISSAIKLTLHLYIEGLVRLAPDNDGYIQRSLRDLVKVYVPRFLNSGVMGYGKNMETSQFSLITKFDTFDHKVRSEIIQTLCSNFIKKKSRSPHVQSINVLRYLKEVIVFHSGKEQVIISIVGSSLASICDIIMFCEEKILVHILAKELLTSVLNYSKNNDSIRDSTIRVLSSLCSEHLAWSSNKVFDLIATIGSETPEIVQGFMPRLVEHIKQVETKRGVGYDRTLRLGLERVEKTLRTIKSEPVEY